MRSTSVSTIQYVLPLPAPADTNRGGLPLTMNSIRNGTRAEPYSIHKSKHQRQQSLRDERQYVAASYRHPERSGRFRSLDAKPPGHVLLRAKCSRRVPIGYALQTETPWVPL